MKLTRLEIHGPTGQVELNPTAAMIRELFLSPPEGYWKKGCGSISLKFSDGKASVSIIVMEHAGYGFHIKYFASPDQQFMSLGNRDFLDEVVDGGDEWYVSKGLFISAEKAWSAIEEFCKTGGMSDRIEWATPEDIPEGGNF